MARIVKKTEKVRMALKPIARKFYEHVWQRSQALSKYEDTHLTPPVQKEKIAKYICDTIWGEKTPQDINLLDAGVGPGDDTLTPLIVQLVGRGVKNITVHGFDNSQEQLDICERKLDEFAKIRKYKVTKVREPNLEIEMTGDSSKVLVNLHNFDWEKESAFFADAGHKFDVILAKYFLHHLLNWRMGVLKLLSCLKTGGALVLAERMGDFAVIDNNWSGFNRAEIPTEKKGFYDFVKKFQALRNEHFKWNPEVRASHHRNVLTFLEPIFSGTCSEEFSYEWPNFQLSHIYCWIRGKALTPFFVGIREGDDPFREYLVKCENSDLPKQITLSDGHRIHVLNGYAGQEGKAMGSWMEGPLLKKITEISDSRTTKVAKEFLDLMTTHDMFLPQSTVWIAINPWDLVYNRWGSPMHLAINYRISDKDRVSYISDTLSVYLQYVKFTEELNFSLAQLIFLRMSDKSPISIKTGDTNSFDTVEGIGGAPSELSITLSSSLDIGCITTVMNDFEEKLTEFVDGAIPVKSGVVRLELDDEFLNKALRMIDMKLDAKLDNVAEALLEQLKKHPLFEDCFSGIEEGEKKSFMKALIGVKKFFMSDDKVLIRYIPSKGIREEKNAEEKLRAYGFGGMIVVEKPLECECIPPLMNNKMLSGRSALIDYLTQVMYLKIGVVNWSAKTAHTIIGFSSQKAVASIMSRNGSHNIGSHVIAAVTDSINDLPDDQILLAYIQHRMDFIATITSEFPEWSYPVWFVKDLMRRFYMQRHLLNYIASSEELRAYEPQATTKGDQQNGKLVIKIRGGADDKNWKMVIDPTDGKDAQNVGAIAEDVLVAIPGGVIGHQAFYTILENIIRNSAKHGYAVSDKKKDTNLEITIDFLNDLKKDYVKIRIWDNMSSVCCKEKDRLPLPSSAKSDPIHWESGSVEEQAPFNKLPLHQKMNCRICRSFIKRDTGDLLRENWGLAEMKISAGYLKIKSVEEIGGEGAHMLFRDNDAGQPDGIIAATTYKDGKTDRLAYEFCIPRPKEVLIIGYTKPKTIDRGLFRQYSIFFEDEVPQKLDYEFVVLCNPELLQGDTVEKFPARLFLVGNGGNSLDKKAVSISEKDLKAKISELCKNQGNPNNNLASSMGDFKLWLYAKWVEHLGQMCGFKDKKINVCINVEHKSGGGASSHNSQLLRKLFELTKASLPAILGSANLNNVVVKGVTSKIDTTNWNELPENHKIATVDNLKTCWWGQVKNGGNGVDDVRKVSEVFRNYIDESWNMLAGKRDTTGIFHKYEEHIETLPRNFRADESKNEWEETYSFDETKLSFEVTNTYNNTDAINFQYERHGSFTEAPEYFESISGSQIYFGLLSKVPPDNYLKNKTILQLVENSMLRIAIVDERICHFAHRKSGTSEGIEKFKRMRIYIPPRITGEYKFEIMEGDSQYALNIDNNKVNGKWTVSYTGKKNHKTDIDVFIIHQGILDKMFPNDRAGAKDFLMLAQKTIPLVAVTSGRGTPDRLPENVKFIPFSNIESFLKKEYPEKFLLTQVITKIGASKLKGN